jgi:Uma2 family endonuclease
MSIALEQSCHDQSAVSSSALPPLRNGDRLDQHTFHERYAAMPDNFRAELIGGIVFVSSPVSKPHAKYHGRMTGLLFHYEAATPGVEFLDNSTVILDDESEPQPDCVLRIDDGYGGRSFTTEDEYVAGPPELQVEVAYSSESIDLNRKRQEYERTGVAEYLVIVVNDRTVRSFLLEGEAYVEQSLPEDRIWRSRLFPGLWVDVTALFEKRSSDLLETLQHGLASEEHQAFVRKLAQGNRSLPEAVSHLRPTAAGDQSVRHLRKSDLPTLEEFANEIGFPAGGTRPPGGNLRSRLKHHFGTLKLEEIGRITDIDHPPIVGERSSPNEPYRLTPAGQAVAREIKRNLEQA